MTHEILLGDSCSCISKSLCVDVCEIDFGSSFYMVLRIAKTGQTLTSLVDRVGGLKLIPVMGLHV